MKSGSSSHIAGSKKGSRRAQTKDEEEAILNILDAVVAKDGQVENGTIEFGSYKYIENEQEKLLPGSGLKAYPHIDFKIRMQKKIYEVIFDSEEVQKAYVEGNILN